ncbi:hypothetical protein D9613_006710 [Agrocybe pediades]|uniref:Uncharacterized protein n=1 Tax=Agrocybe pediades TaxID=84607 RepID=A0A8H4VIL8_9AGAR|nr:hypothetical protein D9613_006710 [Agrocybe pediades]
MAAEANASSSTSNDFGLPPRPPTTSTPLWEHLLKSKGSTIPSLRTMPIIAPPSAPLDKNATSMKHAADLLEEAKTTRHEIKTVHSLFERDRERLVGDIVDLVNRSQKEMQKTMGSPAQTDAVETVFNDVSHRMKELDQRLDAIQAVSSLILRRMRGFTHNMHPSSQFNQSHTQNLQTQIQAVQILLDKQGSIMTAVLPLLPLLQAIPVHIEALRSGLLESFMNSVSLRSASSHFQPSRSISSGNNAVSAATSPLQSLKSASENSLGKRKRTDRTALSPSHSSASSPTVNRETPYKRTRLQDASNSVDGSTALQASVGAASPSSLAGAQKGRSSSRTDVGANKIASPAVHSSPPAPSEHESVSTSLSITRRGTFVVPALHNTPRKPLTDIIAHLSSERVSSARKASIAPSQQQPSVSRGVEVSPLQLRRSLTLSGETAANSTSVSLASSLASGSGSASSASLVQQNSIGTMTAPAAKSPRILRVQSSVRRRLSLSGSAAAAAAATTTTSASVAIPRETTTTPVAQPGVAPSTPILPSRIILPASLGWLQTTNANAGIQVQNVVRQTPVAPSPAKQERPVLRPLVSALPGTGGWTRRAQTSSPRNVNLPTMSTATAATATPAMMGFMRQKDRRSPAREGRRFIPLVDSDDEEGGNEQAFE